MIAITRRLEFDAGHRIPNHKGPCRNLHGHRYAIEISLEGQLVADHDAADEGMVVDYGEIKTLAKEVVVDRWDHAFLVYRQDTELKTFLDGIPDHKTVVLDTIPTAENLAAEAFRLLDEACRLRWGTRLRLRRVRLYETPNAWADAYAKN